MSEVIKLKSSAEQAEEAARAARMQMMKDKASLFAAIQLHLSTARKRNSTELSDEKYAASGHVGDPEQNLIEAVQSLRDGFHGAPTGTTKQ
jgi:hypothetical protein